MGEGLRAAYYRFVARRRTAKRPSAARCKIPLKVYSASAWRKTKPMDLPDVDGEDDRRFTLAIEAFNDCGYRLYRQEASMYWGAAASGLPMRLPATTLVFVPTEVAEIATGAELDSERADVTDPYASRREAAARRTVDEMLRGLAMLRDRKEISQAEYEARVAELDAE